MCKLNINCTAEDGNCGCHKLPGLSAGNQGAQNNLLFSIISFISTQPEILNAISEGKLDPSMIPKTELPLDPEVPDLSPGSETTELQIILLNDLPNKIFVNRPFSVMVEIIDKNFSQVKFEEPITLQAALVDSLDGTDKFILGQTLTQGVCLFKKLEIPEKVSNCSLSIRVLDRKDIKSLTSSLKVCVKKGNKALKA